MTEKNRIIVEGFTSADVDKLELMSHVIEACEVADVEPPKEATAFVEEYNSGTLRKIHKLRPNIDKGVKKEGDEFIIIDLDEINSEIDFIKIYTDSL